MRAWLGVLVLVTACGAEPLCGIDEETEEDRPICTFEIEQVPEGLEFGAIDHEKVHHLFAVVGPKREAGEHLRTLARISKLLRNSDFRARLLTAADSSCAFALVASEEEGRA